MLLLNYQQMMLSKYSNSRKTEEMVSNLMTIRPFGRDPLPKFLKEKMKDDPVKDHPPIWGKDGSQVLFKERYPVVLRTYDKWKELNPLLEKYIRQQGDRINHKSNVKAQMTEWNMQTEGSGEHFQKLVDWVREISLEISPVQFIPDCYDVWGALYKKGDYTISHDHYRNMVLDILCKCYKSMFSTSIYKYRL